MRDKLYTLLFMIAVSAVFTGLVSGVHVLSRERVRLNEDLAEDRVIMQVLGVAVPEDAELRQVAALYEERVRETDHSLPGGGAIYEGRSADGELTGYAFEIAGRGFWDVVKGYMAVSPDLNSVIGIAFHQQSETPGLGAEITKPWFAAQFDRLPIPAAPDADGRYIRLVRPGDPRGASDVDGVTGATGTSAGVEGFLNEDLHGFLGVMGSGRAE